MKSHRYLAVEGPIGVGKTSFVRMLSKELHAKAIYESVDENPFLKRFYQDQRNYAFQTQLFFLLSRYRQQQEFLQQELFDQIIISDYMFEKDRIFACLTLADDELELYQKVYDLLSPRLVVPDAVIYLQANAAILLQRIRKRNKDYERNLSIDYLERLIQYYNQFFFTYSETPLLIVNTSEIDFIEKRENLEDLIRAIKRMGKGTQYYHPIDT